MKHSCNQSNCAAVIVLLSSPRQNRLYSLTAVHLQKQQHFDSHTTVREQQSPWCKSSLTGGGSTCTYSEKWESAVTTTECLSCILPLMTIGLREE